MFLATSPTTCKSRHCRTNGQTIGQCTLSGRRQALQIATHELVPCNTYLPKDPNNWTDWAHILGPCWTQHQGQFAEFLTQVDNIQADGTRTDQQKVDEIWQKFFFVLENFRSKAVHSCTMPMKGTKKPHRLKGAPARLRQKNWLIHRNYDHETPNILRVKRGFWVAYWKNSSAGNTGSSSGTMTRCGSKSAGVLIGARLSRRRCLFRKSRL